MRPRTALCCATLAATALASPAAAAPRGPATPFTFRDATGDAAQAAFDLTAVTVRTTGRVARGGYRPEALVVTLRLAAATARAGATYRLDAQVDGCGFLDLVYAPGTAYAAQSGNEAFLMLECGDPAPTVAGVTGYTTPVPATVSGGTVTWTVPMAALAGVRPGARFSEITARTEVADPVAGFAGAGVASLDEAIADGVWRLG